MAQLGRARKFGPFRVGQWVEYDHTPGLFAVVRRTDRGTIVRGANLGGGDFKLQIRRGGDPKGPLDIDIENGNVRALPADQVPAKAPPAPAAEIPNSTWMPGAMPQGKLSKKAVAEVERKLKALHALRRDLKDLRGRGFTVTEDYVQARAKVLAIEVGKDGHADSPFSWRLAR